MKFTFDFDPQKSVSNETKHGLNFVEAQVLWNGKTLRLASDQEAHGEKRYLELGRIDSKHWTAIVTYRGGSCRIISVRPSTAKEIKLYEDYFRPSQAKAKGSPGNKR